MKLKLTKPLAFIDLETTGLDVARDRIVEISILRLETDGSRKTLTKRINPGIPVPSESSAIHGIRDADLADKADFRTAGPELKQFIGNADLAGYNSNKFDIPLLAEEFLRNDIEFDMSKRKLVDVQNIFHKMEKRTLEAAYKFYCGLELKNSHSAEADVTATLDILEAQLGKYPELEGNVNFLHEFTSMYRNVDLAGRIIRNEKGTEVFNFGKHKGRPVSEVFASDPSYYDWMQKGDFTLDTKRKLTELKLREKTGR